jgi:hypothetical protein
MKAKILKTLLLSTTMFVFGGTLYAQPETTDEVVTKDYTREKFAFKVPIFSFMDFTSPSLNFGIENKVSERLGIHQELGYINSYFNPLYQAVYLRNTHGLKYWIEPRIYLNPTKKSHLFIAPSVYYKYYISNHSEEMLRYGGQYIEMMDYTRFHHQLSFLFKAGKSFKVDKGNVAIDLVGGLGYKYLWISSNLPSDAEFFQFVMISPRPTGFYIRPVAYFGMAIRFQSKE